jgi:hypothetical protein
MTIRDPLLKPLGLNIRAKQPGVMRGLGPNEVKVSIFSRTGALMQVKIGTINSKGICFVRFEGENVEATKEGARWVYRVPVREMDHDE